MGGAFRALVIYGYSKSYLGKWLKVLKRAGDNWFKLSLENVETQEISY